MTTLVHVFTPKDSIEKNLKVPACTSPDENPNFVDVQSALKPIRIVPVEQGTMYYDASNPGMKKRSHLSKSIEHLDALNQIEGGESTQNAANARKHSKDSSEKDDRGNGDGEEDGDFCLKDNFAYNIPQAQAPESLVHMNPIDGHSLEDASRGDMAEFLTTTSLSSRGSTPSNSLPRPLLYSAIGSLENPTGASLGRLQKRLSGAVNRTSLLPPASTFTGSSRTSQSEKVQHHLASPNGQAKQSSTHNDLVQAKSSLRRTSLSKKGDMKKQVSYDAKVRKSKKQVEMFRPSCDAYTPRIEKKQIKYMAAKNRKPVQTMATTMGTLQRPNFRDALRRVAMIIHQHIVKIEHRFESNDARLGGRALFTAAMKDAFSEEKFCTPKYKCTMVRIPMARPGMVFGLRKIKTTYMIPSEKEIYEFAHQLFKSVQLSSECSIVCLIYVERLMEAAKVPLMACTWRPIFMCGLLLASKVWQDLSSWNIEFASVYPQFSLDAINKLEINFLRNIKWDLYISSSLYAKYYFALRSLVEKVDFRQRYNRMVGRIDSITQCEALKIQERSEVVKEEALLQLSRSM